MEKELIEKRNAIIEAYPHLGEIVINMTDTQLDSFINEHFQSLAYERREYRE